MSRGWLGKRQVAELSIRAGRARLRARVAMTPAGLAATGGLVASILLSTAVLVRAAVRAKQEGPPRVSRNGPSALDTLREDS